MMLRLIATIRKEWLVLIRDRSGLAILFLMPVSLVIIMALVQDAPFRDYQELRIPALLVNHDQGNVGDRMIKGLIASNVFSIDTTIETIAKAKELVAHGKYEVGISIPENTSALMYDKVNRYVHETLSDLGFGDSNTYLQSKSVDKDSVPGFEIFFSPGAKKSFRNSLVSGVRQILTKVESELLVDAFTEKLGAEKNDTSANQKNPFGEFIPVHEVSTGGEEQLTRELNSVQHNVPAWTMFGIFFIVISLAGNMIREREDGSYLRLRTMPGSYLVVLTGKIVAFLGVTLVQTLLMLLVGIFLLPVTGLPGLVIGNNLLTIIIVSSCSGLAATGYGVLIGTIFNTHQQASTFGAVSVVILSALGGIWVPVYVLPELLQTLASLSPLNWGLDAFQNTFLGDGTLKAVSGNIYKLLLFFAGTTAGAVWINRLKNNY